MSNNETQTEPRYIILKCDDLHEDTRKALAGFPLADGGVFHIEIDILTGAYRALGANGEALKVPSYVWDVHEKASDGGCYRVLNENREELGNWEYEYVPIFFPGVHWGDYIILGLSSTHVANWNASPASVSEWMKGMEVNK